MPVKSTIERYQANFRAEQEGSLLYQELANTVQDANLAELYRRLSETEQRHAFIWAKRLQAAGQPVPTYTLGLRMRLLVWMAKHFGVSSVLPMISRSERGASRDYEAQPEARAAAMPADERSHARIFRAVQLTTRAGIAGPLLARFEGRHRNASGGSRHPCVTVCFR
jgi:vacuolar iron transporter family protein